MKAVLTTLILLSSTFVSAAIPKNLTSSSVVQGGGILRGGVAGGYYSLLDVRSQYTARHKMERLEIDFGQANFDKLVGATGYYQIELKQNPPRLILNFPQAINTKFEVPELTKRLKKSPHIKSVRVDYDRISQALYLTMELRRPVNVRATPVAGGKKTAKLVVDIVEAGSLKK